MTWKIPVKTEWMKEQSHHLPSMEYAKDIYSVASRMNNFSALEIGCAWGFSTLALLEAGAKNLMSVDPNLNAHGEREAIANGYGDKYAWSRTRSHEFWDENPTASFDLIYVDGSHLYVDVVNDLYEAWKRLDSPGLLMIDDWEHKKNIQAEGDTTEYGVSLACWEFWRDHVDEVLDVGIVRRVLWFAK